MNMKERGSRGQAALNTAVPEDITADVMWWVAQVGISGAADILGVHRMTINRIECGEQLRKKTVARLRAALDAAEDGP